VEKIKEMLPRYQRATIGSWIALACHKLYIIGELQENSRGN
jgi:hypothetical protein